MALALPAFAQSQARPQSGPPGAVKATTSILADGSRETKIVNPDKREATETVTDSSGKVMKKTWYSLDERDFTTGAVHYDAKGNIRYKESYKRDGADRITATYLYSKNDQLLGHRIFNYDGNGKITSIDDYDSKGT
jgi:antitoxin component YwqK of YwqJK toxin-antitoxin module